MRLAVGVAWVFLVTTSPGARARDVTTLSGTTLREVRAVRVDPDGVIWEHATGMTKVAFQDLPEAIRKEFHYDAGKAAAFLAAQAPEQSPRRAVAMSEFRPTQAQAPPQAETKPGEFVFRGKASADAAVNSLHETIAAKARAEELRTKDDGTIWDRRLWAVPKLLFGSDEFDGKAFDPKTDLNSHEYKSGVYHDPGAFGPNSFHDNFYQPIYLTKSYNEDVERAAAFARGHPHP